MRQKILDAWLNNWIDKQYNIIGYEHRSDAIQELLATLKANGLEWYGAEEAFMRPQIIKACTPRKPKKKSKQEWEDDVKQDIQRAAGLVFASDIKFTQPKPVPAVTSDEVVLMPEDSLVPPRRGRPANLSQENIEKWNKRFFSNKSSSDLYEE